MSEIIMTITRLTLTIVLGWPVLVLLALAARVAALGATAPMPEYAGWLLLGSAPAIVAALIARGAPSRSVTQVLWDAEHAGAAAVSRG
jgi:hypothetical protein